jgi:hypothetical protein
MANFFIEGGPGMFPILVLGLILVVTSVRYLLDGEPVRLRFAAVLALALLAAVAVATVLDLSNVMKALASGYRRPPHDDDLRLLAGGLMESSRPAILGFALLALALDLIAIGVYRVGRRELRAART